MGLTLLRSVATSSNSRTVHHARRISGSRSAALVIIHVTIIFALTLGRAMALRALEAEREARAVAERRLEAEKRATERLQVCKQKRPESNYCFPTSRLLRQAPFTKISAPACDGNNAIFV